ncbi:MAG: HPr family phosphocarrier protein [Lachnospiraceae bacterium]|nr:HPr family phosphocarrier protein [Lachnospiraceae bacterium]
MLTKRVIRLRPEQVKMFVKAACQCDFDIDVAAYQNHYVVDAKSILGILGMNLTQNLVVSYSGFNSEFEQVLNHLSIAC